MIIIILMLCYEMKESSSHIYTWIILDQLRS